MDRRRFLLTSLAGAMVAPLAGAAKETWGKRALQRIACVVGS
jgi:hypothetical protein